MIVYYFIISAAVSFLTAWTALQFYLLMPSAWLCEPDEIPREEHLSKNRCPHRIITLFLNSVAAMLFIVLSGYPGFRYFDIQNLILLCSICISLFPAVLSDLDYCIIPDQVCLSALITAFLKGLLTSGLSGLKTAAGIDCIGMGDVKLLTACGALVASFAVPELWATAACTVYIFSILSSAVWFSILLLGRQVQYGEARPLAPWIVFSTLLIIALCQDTA